MQPIDPQIDGLKLVNYGKGPPEYLMLPARRTPDGEVVTCWRLSWRERFTVLFGGAFFVTFLTFNKPLQPMRVSVEKPEYVESA